jgi:hypothetical protein
MNALWPKTTPQALGGQAQAAAAADADAAPATDHSLPSHEVAPVAAALQSSLSRDEQQAVQLLQVNRKLEAQLQVRHADWPLRFAALLCTCARHFCPALISQSHQELKGRVASLEAEKERALAGIGSGKEKFCAQQ